MEVIKSIDEIGGQQKPCCLALGTFDGVHLGHRAVLDTMLAKAKKNNLIPAVFTFQGHPLSALINCKTPPLLTTLEEKIELLTKLGIQKLFTFAFTKEFSNLEPQEFILFLEQLQVAEIVIGFNYTFAKERRGTVDLLETLGKERGINVDVVIPFHLQKSIVSSTLIRQLIHDGEIEEANFLLDYPYFLQGEVIHGFKKGRELGYPTANLHFSKEKVIPANGVYAVELVCQGKKYIGICNVGYRPTFCGTDLSIETHILDFSEDIYGEIIKVKFLKKIRSEQHFQGIEQLMQRIKKDEQFTRDYFLQKSKHKKLLKKYSDSI